MSKKTNETVKIEIEVSKNNEGTSSPYWLIIDPCKKGRPYVDIIDIAAMITGPFFSREEAQNELTYRKYDYSDHAMILCKSGCYTYQYKNKCKEVGL